MPRSDRERLISPLRVRHNGDKLYFARTSWLLGQTGFNFCKPVWKGRPKPVSGHPETGFTVKSKPVSVKTGFDGIGFSTGATKPTQT